MDTKKLHEMLDDIFEDKNKKVIKTIPVKPEWKKMFAELEKVSKEKREAQQKWQSMHKLFWSTVENDLGIFTDMSMSEDKKEIKIYE